MMVRPRHYLEAWPNPKDVLQPIASNFPDGVDPYSLDLDRPAQCWEERLRGWLWLKGRSRQDHISDDVLDNPPTAPGKYGRYLFAWWTGAYALLTHERGTR